MLREHAAMFSVSGRVSKVRVPGTKYGEPCDIFKSGVSVDDNPYPPICSWTWGYLGPISNEANMKFTQMQQQSGFV